MTTVLASMNVIPSLVAISFSTPMVLLLFFFLCRRKFIFCTFDLALSCQAAQYKFYEEQQEGETNKHWCLRIFPWTIHLSMQSTHAATSTARSVVESTYSPCVGREMVHARSGPKRGPKGYHKYRLQWMYKKSVKISAASSKQGGLRIDYTVVEIPIIYVEKRLFHPFCEEIRWKFPIQDIILYLLASIIAPWASYPTKGAFPLGGRWDARRKVSVSFR